MGRRRTTPGRARLWLSALLIVASTGTIGMSLGVTASAAPVPPPGPLVQPAIPGPGHAYLGGWIKPTATSVQHNQAELAALPPFNQALGRNLSVVSIYQDWLNLTQNGLLEQVLAQGGIPMINWRCGVANTDIIAGTDDAYITQFATQLKALQSPVFLRWYFEPNFPRSSDYQQCIGSAGPTGYQLAFQRMHSLLQAAGATNVAFVWCVATSGDTSFNSYYPGAASVDWIAADGYNRTGTPSSNAFSSRFDQWYQAFAGFGKPMMVTETATFDTSQQTYLQEAANDLSTAYPLIKGLVYFDAPANLGNFPYPLTGTGLQTFQALSRLPLFLPDRQTPTISVAASTSPARAGRPVRLTATTTATDGGGTVSFLANGFAISGCTTVPAYAVPSCAATLPEGQNNIVTSYSGDSMFAAASSPQVAVTVLPPVPTTTPGSKPPRTTGGGPGGAQGRTLVTTTPTSGASAASATITPPTVPSDLALGTLAGFAAVAPVPPLGPVVLGDRLSSPGDPATGAGAPFLPVPTGNGTGAALASIDGTVPPSPIFAHATGWVLAASVVAFLLGIYLVTTSARDRRRARADHNPES